MKVDTKRGTDTPLFKIEDTDSPGIVDLRQLLAGQTMCHKCGALNENTAWVTLQGFFDNLRRWVEEMGKAHAQSRAKKELCDNDFSILTGIDLVIGLPQKLITQSDLLANAQKAKLKEDDNAGETNEYGD